MDNPWQRRSQPKNVSTTGTSNVWKDEAKSPSSRTYQSAKRFDTFSKQSVAPSSPSSPPVSTQSGHGSSATAAASSSAFGLGSGAFASFGSAIKTAAKNGSSTDQVADDSTGANSSSPPQNPLASKNNAPRFAARNQPSDHQESSRNMEPLASAFRSSTNPTGSRIRAFSGPKPRYRPTANSHATPNPEVDGFRPLQSAWTVWYRPPTSKYSNYEKSTVPLGQFSSVESFWLIYTHLKRPSELPPVSDYHLFRKGIRPVWEDEENKRGGKWIIKLKKGVADRYWEDLLLAIIGDTWDDGAGDEICGAVLSVRNGEDVLSIWCRYNGGKNAKIRDSMSNILGFPADTSIVWKSHDSSMAQRTAIEHARQEKFNNHHAGAEGNSTAGGPSNGQPFQPERQQEEQTGVTKS